MYVVGCCTVYLSISFAVTVWVARTLHNNGRIFLADAFHGDAALADSVDHWLVVGFYLVNFGYVALALATRENLQSVRLAIAVASDKIGVVLLVLGGMHFLNLFVFSRMRARARAVSGQEVSLAPQAARR
jgi:hypothetical protein